MTRSHTRGGWREHLASLREQAAAGNVRAMSDLGLDLLEGIQDGKGRSLVRRNPGSALAWLRKAADCGDPTAAGQVGYAYDVGLGTRRNVRLAVRWYRWAATAGNSAAAANLATVYRDAGKARLAFQWWQRSAAMGDGDSAVDVGYCHQHGIGTRRDPARAKRVFRRAISSSFISQSGREAAMYHLALQFLDEGKNTLAIPLLKRAGVDADYPEASAVLRMLKTGQPVVPCRCRRLDNKKLRGHARCLLHPR